MNPGEDRHGQFVGSVKLEQDINSNLKGLGYVG